jgi:hypothetical protein
MKLLGTPPRRQATRPVLLQDAEGCKRERMPLSCRCYRRNRPTSGTASCGIGWRVVGTAWSDAKAPVLQAMSVEPVVIDEFDADGLRNAMAHVRPSVVVHQLTVLPPGLDPSKMREALVRNDPAYASGQREETLHLLVQQRVRRYGGLAVRDRLYWNWACHRRLRPSDLAPLD